MALSTFTTTSASLTLTTGEMLELQPGTNQVLTHLDGWFSPAGTRREGTSRLWAHGSFSERGWRDERVITLGGHIFTESRADAANMTDTLSAALADGTAGKFIVDDVDLGYREATVYITGTPTVNWDGNLDIFFMIDMVAPDPRKYGEAFIVSTPAAAPGGGLTYDLFSTGGWIATSPGNLADNAAPYNGNGWATSSSYVRSYEIVYGRPAIVVTKSGSGSYLWYGRNMGTSGTSTGTPSSTANGGLVPITPGQTAYTSVDMGTDKAGMTGKIVIRFFNSSGAELAGTASTSPSTAFSLNTWQTFTHNAVAPANSAYFYAENVIEGSVVGGERGWAGDAYLGTTPPVPSNATLGRGPKLRTNYAKQPSVEYASDQWTPYGTSVTGAVMTDGGKYGTRYYRLTYGSSSSGFRGRYHDESLTVTGGQTWTASMWVRPSTTLTLRLGMEFRNGAGLVGSSVPGTGVSCPANVWTRLSVTGTAAGAADTIRVQTYAFEATFPAGATYDLDAEQIELGSTPTDYFDGSSAASGVEYAWAGTVGNSVSEEYELISGVLDFGAAGSSGSVTLENTGTADTAPVFTVSGYAPGFTITEVSTGARLIYTGTVLAGQTLTIDAADGSVLLDGYADRSAYLIRREWTRVPGRTRYTYLFESPGNDGASLTLGVKPAWW